MSDSSLGKESTNYSLEFKARRYTCAEGEEEEHPAYRSQICVKLVANLRDILMDLYATYFLVCQT